MELQSFKIMVGNHEHSKEYLDPSLNYELVLRTDDEFENSNSKLIPVPEGANYAYTGESIFAAALFFKDDSEQCSTSEKNNWYTGTYARKDFEIHFTVTLVWQRLKPHVTAYDQPSGERSAARTASAFNAITGKDLQESEVWLILQLVKVIEQWERTTYPDERMEHKK